MRARGSKSGVKNETPKLPEPREYLGKIRIFLLLNSIFPHTKFNFLQRLSDFQEIRENLLQWLSNFFNGFPLSEKYEKIYLRRQVYKISLFDLRISRHLLPEPRNSR
jgi:hypothetical protein